MDNGAVRVELGSGVAGVVGEFFDEIFVALAQLVLGQVGNGQLQRAKMLDQVAQHGVGEAVFVGPLGVAKDAIELVGIGGLDGAQGVLQGAANIGGRLTHPAPVGLTESGSGDSREEGELLVTVGLGQRGPRLLVEHVAQALVEQ